MNAPKAIHNADNYVSACATRSVPWFLAATVAIQPADREMCRKGLTGCGPQKGYQDNLAAIERGQSDLFLLLADASFLFRQHCPTYQIPLPFAGRLR